MEHDNSLFYLCCAILTKFIHYEWCWYRDVPENIKNINQKQEARMHVHKWSHAMILLIAVCLTIMTCVNHLIIIDRDLIGVVLSVPVIMNAELCNTLSKMLKQVDYPITGHKIYNLSPYAFIPLNIFYSNEFIFYFS